ncbi:hypothetical protein CHS0354_016593 [Potamilus streckersoni]|uniref:RRM domain-containing protein n=1 Tax=Potamilus streckersoni TaxID=2493646 RepID=A0AAE0TI59_9BIVA|nr:hypothetical protein CHS0354_016593 [Potamilus streckersoni]
MGDYGLGIHANIRALSPIDLNQFVNNQSLFSPDSSPRTMQDETLLEKSASKQQQQTAGQELIQYSVTEHNGDNSMIKNGKLNISNSGQDDKKSESVSSALQLDASTTLLTSLASAPSFWAPPISGAADDTFLQGFQSLNGTVTFQQFPPSQNTVFTPGMSTHMANMNIPHQPPQRRAITAQHNFPQRPAGPPQQQGLVMNTSKSYPTWSSAHQNQTQTLSPWTNFHQQQQQQYQRRSVPNMNLNPMAHAVKKTSFPHQFNQSMSIIAPSKFRRSTSFPGQMHNAAYSKPNLDFTSFEDIQREGILSYQDRSSSYDTMKFTNFESQLLDIMRSTTIDPNEQMKSKVPFLFGEETSHMLDDGGLDQTVPNLSTPTRGSPSSQTGIERVERYSRKVFVGGLPPDIDEEEITGAFRRFGPLVVDWPHKAESKSYFPPKGYCFLLFQDEMSVQALIESCMMDDDKLYWCVSSPTMKDKPVQIRPWNLSDSDFVMDGSQPLDPRKTIFVGGVPRPLRAVELAMIMDRLYGGVCYAGIDTDPELKYPKGAGRVAFSSQQSYIAAISARFVQLQHGEIDKRVEVKPYVLDDQMCDECHGTRCGGKFAPFFCANVTCLQYYCEHCWAQIHARPGREFHKPLVKEGADRPRAVPFRWC